MLDENARLIEVVVAKQNEGKVSPSTHLRLGRGPACTSMRDHMFSVCGTDYVGRGLQVDECQQLLSKLHQNLCECPMRV